MAEYDINNIHNSYGKTNRRMDGGKKKRGQFLELFTGIYEREREKMDANGTRWGAEWGSRERTEWT